jgi:hypothetical protein
MISELFVEHMRIMLRICMHAYCIIHGRVLMQSPEERYDESRAPYLFGLFPLRDMHCRPKCLTTLIKPRAQDQPWESFDMIAFAQVLPALVLWGRKKPKCGVQKATLAEFTWAVVDWITRAPTPELGKGVFDPKAVAKFCQEDIHEHATTQHFNRMCIRLADTSAEVAEFLNKLLPGALIDNYKKKVLSVEERGILTTKSVTTEKCSLVDTARLILNGQEKTPIHQVESKSLQSCNWIAWLGTTALFTYPTLDPHRPAFDTSQAALAPNYTPQQTFLKAVSFQAYLLCAGKPVSAKAGDVATPEEATPPLNTVRMMYSAYLDANNRLNSPLHSMFLDHERNRLSSQLSIGPYYTNVATALTSPLNTTWPAWVWLWSTARDQVTPESMKKHSRPIQDQALYREVCKAAEGNLGLPLFFLLQLNKMTGFNRIGIMPFEIPTPPDGKFVEAEPKEEEEPAPRLIDKDVLGHARFLESLADSKKAIDSLRFMETCIASYATLLKVLFFPLHFSSQRNDLFF